MFQKCLVHRQQHFNSDFKKKKSFISFKKCIDVYLVIYSIVFISAIRQSDSVVYTLFHVLFCYAIWQGLVVYE